MLSLKRLIAILGLFVVLASLPTATQCDTSYYEKYYAARRFRPQQRASLTEFEFSVRLAPEERLADFVQLAVVGDLSQLGEWRVDGAVLLNRTDEHSVWSNTVQLPSNASFRYRYFVVAIDKESGARQVRRWESHIEARSYNLGTLGGNRTLDNFGVIGDTTQREVQRGWIHSGRVVQFKVFRNPLRVQEIQAGEQLRLKVQPVEPNLLTPLLPSAKASTEYVRMRYGDSRLRPQPEYGVPYEEDDIVIFHTTLNALNDVAYLVRLYATHPSNDLVRLVGYSYVYPQVLQGTEGEFVVDLISPVWLHVIGSLQLHYLVIAPTPNSNVDFRTTFVEYWRANWTRFDVGHRGMGKSLTQAVNAPALIENTVASMKAVAEMGGDLVEFDVQLTSDLVPIIYHDFAIHVCMDPKKPTSRDDLTEVLIKDITYEQLKNLKTYQTVGLKIVEYPAHNTVEDEDQRLFPSFEDFLTKVNKSLGFDIEIKWPQLRSNGQYESMQTIDKNVFVDRILQVMQQHGCGRFSFFTSFDADICTMLRFKQNMYPVMYLFSSADKYYADPRSDTITDVINNAQAFELAGIVPNAVSIQRDPGWIEAATKQGKKVFVWGDLLKDDTSIEWFKDQGPHGVIYDRMDLWLPADKHNAFELEADLPEFFQLQCSPGGGNTERNQTIDFL